MAKIKNVQTCLKGLLCSEEAMQFMRFCIVGVIATAFHYGIYWVLYRYINYSIAYTIGYIISLICNFVLTSFFTFRTSTSVRKGVGFFVSHVVNYTLHIILLNAVLSFGIEKNWAPLPVFCIVVPVNFMLLRYVFNKK